jgi:hypothetical protein
MRPKKPRPARLHSIEIDALHPPIRKFPVWSEIPTAALKLGRKLGQKYYPLTFSSPYRVKPLLASPLTHTGFLAWCQTH